MVLEVADIRITPGRNAEFEAAIERGAETVISRSRGFHGYKVNRGVESPNRYLLMIYWESVQIHDDFRKSPAFGQWRAIVGPFFAAPPAVEHFELVAKSR